VVGKAVEATICLQYAPVVQNLPAGVFLAKCL